MIAKEMVLLADSRKKEKLTNLSIKIRALVWLDSSNLQQDPGVEECNLIMENLYQLSPSNSLNVMVMILESSKLCMVILPVTHKDYIDK